MTFGELVFKYRELSNLNTRDAAALIGISQSALSLYENERRSPTFRVAVRIIQGLRIPMREFEHMVTTRNPNGDTSAHAANKDQILPGQRAVPAERSDKSRIVCTPVGIHGPIDQSREAGAITLKRGRYQSP